MSNLKIKVMDTKAVLNGLTSVAKGAFANIEYRSEVKGVKRLGLGDVTKVVKMNVQLNAEYESSVNRRLEKQGDEPTFKAQGLPFGEWLVPNKVITYNGKLYLRAYSFKNSNPQTTYYINGRVATESETKILVDHFAKKNPQVSHTQESAGLTENQVKPFAVAFENIISLHCGTCQLI